MILPASTLWPPDFLTPSRRPAESRPLREEPPAFLCAMGEFLTSSASTRASCQPWLPASAPLVWFPSWRVSPWPPAWSWPRPSARLLLRLLRLGLCSRLRRLLAVGQNLGDAQRRQLLAMTLLAAIVLPPLFLEDDDLLAARLLDHLGSDRRAGDRGGAGLGAVAAKQDHLGKLDDIAGLARDLLD